MPKVTVKQTKGVKLNFKPKQVTKKLIGHLQDRSSDVIISRFGLGVDLEHKTLEAIGEKYGITRERVRQIEHAALTAIRKHSSFKEENQIFTEIKNLMKDLGSLIEEEELLTHISADKSTQNHVHFYLVLGEDFKKIKEDDHYKSRWHTDDALSNQIHEALTGLYQTLGDGELVTEGDFITKFIEECRKVNAEVLSEEVAKRYLRTSKKMAKNPLGEWGKAGTSGVKTRGIKDYAYLMMRKHGSPMHFREVAKAIGETFGKKTHTATCHNELIKDNRFILVGRGIYALKEWGYKPGIVREVIKDILRKYGPLSKEDIVEHVMKERYLKKNTILVNLQNAKYFKKNKEGQYSLSA
jgi:hypothetical protein